MGIEPCKDDAKVYSFGMDVLKKFSEGAGDYSKVQFKLRNDTDNYYVQATLTDGVYYVTGHAVLLAAAFTMVKAKKRK